jgi:hypothetical protein
LGREVPDDQAMETHREALESRLREDEGAAPDDR